MRDLLRWKTLKNGHHPFWWMFSFGAQKPKSKTNCFAKCSGHMKKQLKSIHDLLDFTKIVPIQQYLPWTLPVLVSYNIVFFWKAIGYFVLFPY